MKTETDVSYKARLEAIKAARDPASDLHELEALLLQWLGDGEIEALIASNLYNKCQFKPSYGQEPLVVRMIEKLADSSEPSCRWSVAKNSCTPPHVLEKLSQDRVVIVRALVATNPSTPPSILTRLFYDEKSVRDGLTGNPATPAKLLALLADDPEEVVRARVAANPSTPKSALERLAKDPDDRVADTAKKQLGEKNIS
ncbi:MAG: hypothetical protein K6347_05125 [Campylobacterales bacterium]